MKMRKMDWFCLIVVIFVLMYPHKTNAYRIPRPHTFSHPLDQQQINLLNDALEDIWNLQNGEFNLDIVTTSKTQPNNGDIWIFNDSGTFKLEFRAGGSTRTITP